MGRWWGYRGRGTGDPASFNLSGDTFVIGVCWAVGAEMLGWPTRKICVGSSPNNLNIVNDGGVAAVESIVPDFPTTASFSISETFQGPVHRHK